jgi:hypothetical protein
VGVSSRKRGLDHVESAVIGHKAWTAVEFVSELVMGNVTRPPITAFVGEKRARRLESGAVRSQKALNGRRSGLVGSDVDVAEALPFDHGHTFEKHVPNSCPKMRNRFEYESLAAIQNRET